MGRGGGASFTQRAWVTPAQSGPQGSATPWPGSARAVVQMSSYFQSVSTSMFEILFMLSPWRREEFANLG